MSEIDSLAQDLKQWADQHRLEEHALKSFFAYMDNYKDQEPEEFAETFPDFAKEKLDVRVQDVALSFDWQNSDNSTIIAHIPIVYRQVEIGWYRVEYSVLGELLDAWWCYHV